MKKILAIIPTLVVAGALLFSPATDKDKKSTAAPQESVVMMSDPGVGW
ncbi:hypothetical protein [Bacillus sp. XF8]|nr:hypothetical protein [Bacillus sp. XF8]MBO1583003.1 hypothetical protein [Bacillus sp. XF8]